MGHPLSLSLENMFIRIFESDAKNDFPRVWLRVSNSLKFDVFRKD